MKDSTHQDCLADCLGEPTGRESQAGRAGLEGNLQHKHTTRQNAKPHNNTTRQQKKHAIKGKNNKRK